LYDLKLETKSEGCCRTFSVTVDSVEPLTTSEVIQCYVGHELSSVSRPVKELRAIAKVSLRDGSPAVVRFHSDRSWFSRWDENEHCWRVDKGSYRISIGKSSADAEMLSLLEVIDYEILY